MVYRCHLKNSQYLKIRRTLFSLCFLSVAFPWCATRGPAPPPPWGAPLPRPLYKADFLYMSGQQSTHISIVFFAVPMHHWGACYLLGARPCQAGVPRFTDFTSHFSEADSNIGRSNDTSLSPPPKHPNISSISTGSLSHSVVRPLPGIIPCTCSRTRPFF